MEVILCSWSLWKSRAQRKANLKTRHVSIVCRFWLKLPFTSVRKTRPVFWKWILHGGFVKITDNRICAYSERSEHVFTKWVTKNCATTLLTSLESITKKKTNYSHAWKLHRVFSPLQQPHAYKCDANYKENAKLTPTSSMNQYVI